MASSAPRGLRSDHVVTVGIALFSMLFGAGNLIIPPLLALQAGSATPVAMLGFLIAAIGLPVMGFIAVVLASINIFGGFIVTRRMLAMFKKKT